MTPEQTAVAKAIRQTAVFPRLDAHTVRSVALLIQAELAAASPDFDGGAFMLACGFSNRPPRKETKQ